MNSLNLKNLSFSRAWSCASIRAQNQTRICAGRHSTGILAFYFGNSVFLLREFWLSSFLFFQPLFFSTVVIRRFGETNVPSAFKIYWQCGVGPLRSQDLGSLISASLFQYSNGQPIEGRERACSFSFNSFLVRPYKLAVQGQPTCPRR